MSTGLGARIVQARTAVGHTQTSLAKAIGLSRFALARYEKGATHEPRLSCLVAIAQTCGVRLDWLVGLDPDTPARTGAMRQALLSLQALLATHEASFSVQMTLRLKAIVAQGLTGEVP